MHFGMGGSIYIPYTILTLLNNIIHLYKHKYSLYDIINKYCISEQKIKYILILQNSF